MERLMTGYVKSEPRDPQQCIFCEAKVAIILSVDEDGNAKKY